MPITIGPNISIGRGIVVDDFPTGQVEYTTAGTYSWTAPIGVTSVSVVCVGGGGGGGSSGVLDTTSGGGGGLGWKNNISVVAGQSYTVVVGAKGNAGSDGSVSYFINTSTVAGFGGTKGNAANQSPLPMGNGGTYVGDGGGNGGGGVNNSQAGGGAGGYSGNGGNPGQAGSGGGGGGGVNSGDFGGGVGIYGEGASGTAGNPGSGGSGATYGGGAGKNSSNSGGGAVRIIWGRNRAFPSTRTQNL